MRVLVVDDDPIAREYLAGTLGAQGHEVLVLESAGPAPELVREQRVDAVVVDVSLPDMSGDALARRLRDDSAGAELGIVLVSSRSVGELEALAKSSSADAVVTKAEVDSQLIDQVARARRLRRHTLRPGRKRNPDAR